MFHYNDIHSRDSKINSAQVGLRFASSSSSGIVRSRKVALPNDSVGVSCAVVSNL